MYVRFLAKSQILSSWVVSGREGGAQSWKDLSITKVPNAAHFPKNFLTSLYCLFVISQGWTQCYIGWLGQHALLRRVCMLYFLCHKFSLFCFNPFSLFLMGEQLSFLLFFLWLHYTEPNSKNKSSQTETMQCAYPNTCGLDCLSLLTKFSLQGDSSYVLL